MDDFMQKRCNSSVLAMELRLFCIKLSICPAFHMNAYKLIVHSASSMLIPAVVLHTTL